MGAEADAGISRELRDKIAKKLDYRRWGQRGGRVVVFSVLPLLLLLLLLLLSSSLFLCFTTFYMDVIELFTSWKRKL